MAGQLVACTVTASDGKSGTDTDTGSVTIGNTAPVVSSVTLSPSTVYTSDTLTATVVSSDADGDSLTTSYAWYVGGSLVSATSSTLSGASYFSKGQAVYVTASANDGTTTTSLSSSAITVSNTAPSAPVVAITPVDAELGDDLTCTVTTASTDVDGDALTYAFAWDVDGVDYASAADSATDSVVDGADVGGGEEWTCEVVATDGALDSDRAAASVLTCPLGLTETCAAPSCAAILDADGSSGDGTYWVDFDGSGAFEIYCDMTTDGGGWVVLWQIGSPYPLNESTGGASGSVQEAYNLRWGLDGTATTTTIDELSTTGDWSEPRTWALTFAEWQVGSDSQGFRYWEYSGTFNDSAIVGTCAETTRDSWMSASTCSDSRTCTTVPGIGYDTASVDGWYIGFNQVRTRSPGECRFSYGHDDDIGVNDMQHGIMCWYPYGYPAGHLRMQPAASYRLMAR